MMPRSFQIRLDTVVRAATDRDLEFVRKRDAMVALVKTMVNLLRQCKAGVKQAVLTGRSLAGDDRTDLAPVPPVCRPVFVM